jgi:hypothetical protein
MFIECKDIEKFLAILHSANEPTPELRQLMHTQPPWVQEGKLVFLPSEKTNETT